MSELVKYVAWVEESTGRIGSVEFPQAVLPPEGPNGNGYECVHVTPSMMQVDFLSQGFNMAQWVWDGASFVDVGTPPNEHAWYDGEHWTWDHELLMDDVRAMRNALLTSCDWTQVSDAPLDDAAKQAWADYRNALRNFPNTVGAISSLNELVWPTRP